VIALDVPLAWTPGEQTEVPVTIVYAIITGSGLVVVLGTGLVAWWLNRRARRRELGLLRVPKPRRARRVKAAAAAPAERPDIEGAAIPGPVEVAVPAQRQPLTFGLEEPPVRRAPDPRWVNEASGEYMLLRAATARAHTVANQARRHTQKANSVLDTAERVYEEARRAHAESLAAMPASEPEPVPSNGTAPGADRDVARAALDAYRRGEISAEDLRKVWYGTSGWDARHDEAEQRTRERRAAEVHARQEYHIALARARSARQAEYVADVAVRALGAETAAAANELASAHDNTRPKRKWLRNRAQPTAGATPVTARPGTAGATAG
jgi:hypothetical protein